MMYVCFDTNIWLNLIKINNIEDQKLIDQLTTLQYLIENNKLVILFPDKIKLEWDSNKEHIKKRQIDRLKQKIDAAKKDWKEFTPGDNNIDNLERLINHQIDKIEIIFNKKAVLINITDTIRLKTFHKLNNKEEPFNKIETMSDSIILDSFLTYVETSNVKKSYFVSEDKSHFSDGQNSQMPHKNILKDFKRLNVGYYHIFDIFYNKELLNSYPLINTPNTQLEQRENKLHAFKYYNDIISPYEKYSTNFISDLKHIDFIINTDTPTKYQILFIIILLNIESYLAYFFKKLNNKIWFDILLENNYFSHENNLDPVATETGIKYPFWPVLQYLEKMSLCARDNEDAELSKKIIQILNDVSSHPKDNPYTWYYFLKILNNIPNIYIPVDIFNYLETWFDSKFETDMQSHELCASLLPKFLNDSPSEEDIKKAEKILSFIFSLRLVNKDVSVNLSYTGKSYQSPVKMYWMYDALFKKGLIEKAARYCSYILIIQLLDCIKMILTDFPDGKEVEIIENDNTYTVIIRYKNTDIGLELWKADGTNISNRNILNYESMTENELTKSIEKYLQDSKMTRLSTEKNVNNLIEAIFNDHSNIWIYSLHGFKNEYREGDGVFKTFSLILIELFDLKIKMDFEEGFKLLTSLFSDSKYHFPYFKRITLHILSNNWNDNTKKLFLEMIKDNDEACYFSQAVYSKELYYLLYTNISKFREQERSLLNSIIEQGPKKEVPRAAEKYTDYWKFEWYSALREDPEYKKKYEQYSMQSNMSHEEFERTKFVFSRVGEVSPVSKDALLLMSSEEIFQKILSFNPKDGFDEPSVEGFADVLQKAIQENPAKFSNEIKSYRGLPYIYMYHMLHGFRDAWKNKKEFDWGKVLGFCLSYIEDGLFGSDELITKNDVWKANGKWVIGAIADLISDGTRNDDHASDIQLLPYAKEILLSFVEYIVQSDDYKETNMDYYTYTLNSTNGKVINAIFDYALRNARQIVEKDLKIRWEGDVRQIFDSFINNKIIDVFILQGLYFKQFYYLDPDWIEKSAKKYYELEGKYWRAFICSYAFSNPLYRKDIYKIMKPHYERFIIEKDEDKNVLQQMAVYYIWDYESLEEGSLFKSFIDGSSKEKLSDLIYFITGEVAYYRTMNDKDKKQRFFHKVISLWKYLLSIFKEVKMSSGVNIDLLHLTVYFDTLDQETTDLVIQTCNKIDSKYDLYHFFKEFVRLKDQGESQLTAKYIGEIYRVILDKQLFGQFTDPEDVRILVTFLYENGQKEIADIVCNAYTERGNESLRDIWEKYNV